MQTNGEGPLVITGGGAGVEEEVLKTKQQHILSRVGEKF